MGNSSLLMTMTMKLIVGIIVHITIKADGGTKSVLPLISMVHMMYHLILVCIQKMLRCYGHLLMSDLLK